MGPRLSVSGSFRIRGKNVKFSGVGYAERSWQNVPHKMAKRWFNLRAINKDFTLIATEWLPLRGWRPRSIPSLSIAYKERWILHAKADKVRFSARQHRKDKVSGYRVPQYVRYRSKLPGGGSVDVVIRNRKVLHRLDVLSHVNSWLRNLVQKLITKPYLFRYRSTVKLKIRQAGKVRRAELRGLSEWVFLNP